MAVEVAAPGSGVVAAFVGYRFGVTLDVGKLDTVGPVTYEFGAELAGKPERVEIGGACTTYGLGVVPNADGVGAYGLDAYPGELAGPVCIPPSLLRANDADTRAIRSSVNAAAGGANGVRAAASAPMLA
jgi:hypothetical protein